jgi:hypothetical protein
MSQFGLFCYFPFLITFLRFQNSMLGGFDKLSTKPLLRVASGEQSVM